VSKIYDEDDIISSEHFKQSEKYDRQTDRHLDKTALTDHTQ